MPIKWYMIVAGVASVLGIGLLFKHLVMRPDPKAIQLLASRDTARAQRDSLIKIVNDGLARRDTVVQTIHDTDAVARSTLAELQAARLRTNALQVRAGSAEDLAKVFAATVSERDSAIDGWDRAEARIAQQDTVIRSDTKRLVAANIYSVTAEARIDTLETTLARVVAQVKGRRLFGIPIPKLVCVVGPTTPDVKVRAGCGLGYQISL